HVHAIAGQVAVIQPADITAGTEGLLAVGAQNHDAHLIVIQPGVQLLAQLADHVQVQGVESGGAVERQVADAVAHLDQYSLLGHSIAPLYSLMMAEKSSAP